MNNAGRILLAVAVCLIAGCGGVHYDIEMTPNAGQLDRTVTKDDYGPFVGPRPDVDGQGEALPRRSTWSGSYRGRLPGEDALGGGAYTTFTCDMGTVAVYLERFGGQDDPAAAIARQFHSADVVADVLADWARKSLSGRKDSAKLAAYLDSQFRTDLKNLAFFARLHSIAGRQIGPDGSQGNSAASADAIARIVQYLIEHDYFTADDLPAAISWVIAESDLDHSRRAVEQLLERILTRKVGLTDKGLVAELVAGLLREDAPALSDSLARHVAQNADYKRDLAAARLRCVQASQPESLVENDLPPLKWLTGQFNSAISLDVPSLLALGPGGAGAHIALKTSLEPFLTNGRWDGKSGRVSWSAGLGGNSLPVVCFAAWATPDEDFQQAHLGKAILFGQSLAEYCQWRRLLTAEEAAQWDRFISAVRPDRKLAQTLGAFRFEKVNDVPGRISPSDPGPVRGAELIVSNLH